MVCQPQAETCRPLTGLWIALGADVLSGLGLMIFAAML
jgi:hypothetical protein